MNKISAKKIAQALYEELRDLDRDQIKSRISNLLDYLLKNKNLKIADKIVSEFEFYAKAQEGVIDVELISAVSLSLKNKNALEKKLIGEKKVKKVNFIEKLDKRLLGGVIIKIGDTIYDNSLKTRLELLKQQINK